MKRIIPILLLASLAYSCKKVLDKPLLDQMSEDTYWKSPTDLKLYINQFYPTFNGKIAYYNLDENSDNLQPISPSEILDGTRSVPASAGGWNWSNIRKINYFLENAPKVTGGSKIDLDQYTGEGYFFKAYFYFQLVQTFGDVPWYNKVLNINSKELMDPRINREIIIDSIINDLNKAIELLQQKSKLPTGRLNLGCALLFKSRVCLYEGTWEKYHEGDPFGVKGSNGQKYLEMAASSSEKLIAEGTFKVYSTGNPDKDYYDLFNRIDLSDNSEVLLYQTVDPSIGLGSEVWTYLNGFLGYQTGVTKQLVDYYLCTDGKPISLSNKYEGDTTILQTTKNRDPRIKQTIWVPGQIQIDREPNPIVFKHPTLNLGSFDLSTTGYMIRKGSTTDPDQNQGASGADYGKTDGIVFRYAEVLLNYAEAKAELATLTQEDLDISINLLRGRAGMPPLHINVGYVDPNWNFPELSPIINEIRRERRVELALEGFRCDDLMRWAAGNLIKGKRWKGARFIKGVSFPDIEDQISNIPVDQDHYIDRYQNSLPNGFRFNEKRDYLYPLPIDELTLNENLNQNPGW